MGGKRPDQHNIDPAEGSSTNHQWRGEGRSGDERIETEEKQKISTKRHDQPMIPDAGTNPATRDLQDRKAGATKKDENRHASDVDDRVDEASEESFPASDPPSIP